VILLRDIRYVRLGTRDLDTSARFARDILGLEPAGCETNARYFRSDSRDHTLVPATRCRHHGFLPHRPGPPPDLERDVPLLRRPGRDGVRVFQRGQADSFCMWGSRPDIPEFRDQAQSGAKAA
jgi:catechol 2,3-dioxygenase-like lactoylglutathione lyase family enzyme